MKQLNYTIFLAVIFLCMPTISRAMDGIVGVSCTVESKLGVIEQTTVSIESTVCQIEIDLPTLDSKVDLVDISAVIQKSCTIESVVDGILLNTFINESTIDNVDIIQQTIISKLDIIDGTAEVLTDKSCSIESTIDVIDDLFIMIESQLDQIISIESKVDVVVDESTSLESKVCVVDDKTVTLESVVDVLNNITIVIDSSIDVIDSKIESSQLITETIESVLEVINDSADIAIIIAGTIESKLCIIESKVDDVDDDLDVIKMTLNTTDVKAISIEQDFNETWTVLNSILEKTCTVESKTDLITSFINDTILVDQAGTFTAIEALVQKTCTLDSKVDQLNVTIEGGTVSFDGTFTMLDTVLEKLCNSDSFMDEINLSTTVLEPLQSCLGTPIRQEDVSTTGFTISTSGRYYLAENILFEPGAGVPALTISADNVHLDLSGKVLQQNNNVNGSIAISISGTRDNIAIVGGTIRGFRADGISATTGVTNLLLENLIIEDIGFGIGGDAGSAGDAIDLTSSSYIVMRKITVLGTIDIGLNIDTCTDLFAEECNFINSVSSSGVSLDVNSSELCFVRCNFNGNAEDGINGLASIVLVENCIMNDNGRDGIGISGTGVSEDWTIRKSIMQGNIENGIRLSDDSARARFVVVENVISNNGTNGVLLESLAGIENNIFLLNSLVNNGNNNITELTNTGPNSYLGNFAFHDSGDSNNYVLTGSSITGAKSIISQSGAFPTTLPTYWYNISMTP